MQDLTSERWAAAERVAAAHREERLRPPARRRRADRWLRPIVIGLWIAAVALAVAALSTTGERREVIGLVAASAELVLLAVGIWWALSSGRLLLRGHASSIRTALPAGAWPSVRRQLAGREAPDPDHVSVVLELAHQQRRLLGGQVALFAFYLPMYLSIAANSRDWIGPAFLVFGTVVGAVGAVFLVVAYRRFSRLIALADTRDP